MRQAGKKPNKRLVRRHFVIGWRLVLTFLTLGIALEAMHGFKIGWYLEEHNTTRRLMWTLAHAHGVLLGVLHLGFAATMGACALPSPDSGRFASTLLTVSSVLVPTGFFLGGVWTYRDDPGLGILLVPIGAVMLFVAVFLTGRMARFVHVGGEN